MEAAGDRSGGETEKKKEAVAKGSTIRLRPEHKDHVWSYDIVEDKTYDGKKFRILNIIDEYTRECLLSFASRRITSTESSGASDRSILQKRTS